MPAMSHRLLQSRPAKLLRIALQFGRAAWLVALRFPHLQQVQKLAHIQRWSQQMLAILEIEVASNKLAPSGFAGLVVSNHLSWLDILVLQSLLPGAFVAKTEVRRWPVVGYLAQACATIFVDRASPRSARAMAGMCCGSQAINASISGIGWVIEATYCLLQRPICRSK